MTISRSKFESIALEVAKAIPEFLWSEGCGYESGVVENELKMFSNALIKRVEEESEIAEHLYTYVDDYGRTIEDVSVDKQGREFTAVPLIALPLVAEE